MEIVLLLILISLLGIMAWQDFVFRSISWFLFPLLFILSVLYNVMQTDVYIFAFNFSINFLFVSILLLLLSLYFSLKSKRMVNIINKQIGLGDVLFFISAATFFSPVWYLFFFLFGLMLSLVFAVFFILLKQKQSLIPLAGIMALLQICCTSWVIFSKQHFFYDTDIINWLNV